MQGWEKIFRYNHIFSHKTDTMEANLSATFDAGSSFNTKLRDTLQGLLSANNERKSEIDALRGDHDTLKKDHDALVNTTERENDLRWVLVFEDAERIGPATLVSISKELAGP